MKSNLTQIGILLITLLGFSVATAQTVNTVTITAPASVAGEYTTVVSTVFGQQLMDDLSGTATFANDNVGVVTDLCDSTMVDDLTGLIAFVDRGTCDFVSKALFVQRAGAVAVIVCNDEARQTEGLPPLGAAAGDRPLEVTIPVLGMLYEDCVTIRTEAEGGQVELTLSYIEVPPPPCDPVVYDSDVIWGANGEGSFDGGLNGWSVDKGTGLDLDDGGWFYDPEARIDRGAFGGTNNFMISPTACNGAMVFDSDFYDTAGEASVVNGVEMGFNDGVCISDAADGIFCEGLLISPEIDLASTGAEGTEIVWTQAIRQFNSQFFILLSDDGGTTWRDTIEINDDLPANTGTENNTQRSIPLCGYNDAENFRFAFYYRSAFYYWAIDDVFIRDIGSIADIRTNDSWYSKYPNLVSPSGNYEELPLMIDLENIGVSTSTGNSLEVEVINLSTLTTVYSETLAYEDITCGVDDDNVLIAQNQVLPMRWTPTEDGDYRVTYTINSDNDVNDSNNVVTQSFSIGGDTFRKTVPPSEGGTFSGIAPGASQYYTYANIYRLKEGEGKRAVSCRYGFVTNAGETFNAIITAQLFKWVDLNGDGSVGGEASGLERLLIGESRLIVSSQTGLDYSDIEFVFENPNDPGADIMLEDNTDYVVAINSSPVGSGNGSLFGQLVNGTLNTEVNWWPTSFAFQQSLPDDESYWVGSMLGIGVEGDETDRDYGPLLFGDGAGGTDAYAVYLPFTIGAIVSDTEDLANDQSISVYPNPVSEKLFIDMNLSNEALDVNLELVNVQGQLVLTKDYSNNSGNLSLDVKGLPGGIYSLNIRTENGLTSKKVIIEN